MPQHEYAYILVVVAALLLFFVFLGLFIIIKRNKIVKKYNYINNSFNKTIGLDFRSKLKKIKRLSPYNEEFQRGYKFWQTHYDNLTTIDKKVIEGELQKAENAIRIRKIRLAEKFLIVIAKDLKKFNNQMRKLYTEIDEVTRIETTQRLEIEKYKEYFHTLSVFFKKNSNDKSLLYEKNVAILKDLRLLFTSFEDHCEVGEFDKVKSILINVHKTTQKLLSVLTVGRTQEKILLEEIPIMKKNMQAKIKNCEAKKIILKDLPVIKHRKQMENMTLSCKKLLVDLHFTQVEKTLITVLNQYEKSEKQIELAVISYDFIKNNIKSVYKMHSKISLLRKELDKTIKDSIHIFDYRHGRQLINIYKERWNQSEELYFKIKKKELLTKGLNPFDYLSFADKVVEMIIFFRNCFDVFYKMSIIQHTHNLLLRQTEEYIAISKKSLMDINSLINKNTTIRKIKEMKVDFHSLNNEINNIEQNYQKNQLNDLKISNEQISELRFRVLEIIHTITAEIKKYNVAEKAIIVANRYRKENSDFSNKISEAEEAFVDNNFDKAIDLAFSVIKSNNPGFSKPARKIN